jgi:hypothetical protein
VRAKGDWEVWLDSFLTGVRDTAEQAAAAAHRILALFDDYRRKIEGLERPAASVLRVFEHMRRNPIVPIPGAAENIGISAPTVAKSLEHMRQLGMLREVTGRQRHRLFVYDAYLAILSEGTEPIRRQIDQDPIQTPPCRNSSGGLDRIRLPYGGCVRGFTIRERAISHGRTNGSAGS